MCSAFTSQSPPPPERIGIAAQIKQLITELINKLTHRLIPKEPSSISMLNLVATKLSVKLRSIDEDSLNPDHKKKTYAIVSEILERIARTTKTGGITADTANQCWDEIYKAESLLALLYTGEQLRQELGASMQELTDLNKIEARTFRPSYEDLVKQSAVGSPELADKVWSASLLRLTEAVHWNKNQQYLLRELYAQATRRVLFFTAVSALLVILPYISPNSDKWSSLPLWTALTSGLLGAFFFRLNDLKSTSVVMTVDQAALQRKYSYTLLRALVGVCGALIVYFLLQSDILKGTLLPEFDKIGIQKGNYAVPSRDLALLTFLCFLAGYSEKLVPSIISGVEEKLNKTVAPMPPTSAKSPTSTA
jgi:hypothetical protein